MNTRTNIPLSALLATACLVCACESTSIVGPSGRRARMVDEQLAAVLKQDFPAGMTRDAVHAKAAELGMTPAGRAGEPGDESAEDAYLVSFAPNTTWGITRTVRVQYDAGGRVERTTLDPQLGRDAGTVWEDETTGGWIRLEGSP